MATNSNEANKSKTYEASQMHTALTLSIGAKMGEVLDNRKEDEIAQRKKLAAYLKSDPLGLKSMTMKEESGKRESMREQRELRQSENKVRINTKRGKQEKDNIFTDFGKAHGNGMHTVQIGGVFQQRADFRRHWRSDPDLRRWQQALTDNMRNDRLLGDVRMRWHENFKADRADLTQKHNALYRQRSNTEEAGQPKATADTVRELQVKLVPKLAKSKKKGNVSFNAGEREKTAVGQIMNFLIFMQVYCPRLEDAFSFIDNNGNGTVSYAEFSEALSRLQFPGDIKYIWRLIDDDHSGLITAAEWKKLEPYVLQLRIQKSLKRPIAEENFDADDMTCWKFLNESQAYKRRGVVTLENRENEDIFGRANPTLSPRSEDSQDDVESEAGKAKTKTAGEPSSPSETDHSDSMHMKRRLSSTANTEQEAVQATGTTEIVQESQPSSRDSRILQTRSKSRNLSIFVYRNADRNHAGEAVFISKPPQNLQDLLFVISRASRTCRPLIEPVAKLLDTSLLPIRGLEQVQNGETYLLKGQESLDPPPHFLARQEKPHGGSIRHLHDVQLASSTEVGALRGWEPHPRRVHRISDHMTRSFSSGPRLLEPIRLTSREPTARAIRSGRFMTASLGPCDTV
mmetsp:Transcript_80048/g.139671  ORF Transcript_80048/g.139671 Transcript_80048/m.139671 type:complete len:628 (-) Transcript_80048:52-1935(-)